MKQSVSNEYKCNVCINEDNFKQGCLLFKELNILRLFHPRWAQILCSQSQIEYTYIYSNDLGYDKRFKALSFSGKCLVIYMS